MLTRNLFLADLAPGDLNVLTPNLRREVLEPGRVLFSEGQKPFTLYLPESVVVSVMTVMSDGRSVENANVGSEAALELLAVATDEVVSSRSVVQIGGEVTTMPAAALRARLADSPTLGQQILRHAKTAACRCGETLACNTLHPADARLSKWLLRTADRVGRNEFAITQEYLAGIMGLQRTTVTAVASRLKKDGLIGYTRGRMRVLQPEALRARACECYGDGPASGLARPMEARLQSR
ncbi:MAG: Crp/Fnr family transcriptional regulator [Caulobacter sp.]|jgi:CRP-like cAMP-binding protein|nr:Crp/Fnr family transcriptional regulator [Caulobacter sp.]